MSIEYSYAGKCYLVVVILYTLFSKCDSREYSLHESEDLNWISENGLLRVVADKIIAADGEDGTNCINDLIAWNSSLTSQMWAMQMLDASGHIPSGILKGNMYSLGNYGECVGIAHKRDEADGYIKGKYCLGGLSIQSSESYRAIENDLHHLATLHRWRSPEIPMSSRSNVLASTGLPWSWGICMPASCNSSAAAEAISSVISLLNLTISMSENKCSTNDPKPWETVEIFGVVFFSIFGVIVLLSTAYDCWVIFYKAGTNIPPRPLLTAFSLYTNSRRLTTLSKDPGPLACLHGIRVISMLWIILGHRYLVMVLYGLDNMVDVLSYIQSFEGMPIIASTVSVDTFFLLSGILLAYIFFRETDNKSLLQIPMLYLHRILRLTPAVALVLLLVVSIIPRFGDGPVYAQFHEYSVTPCKEKWWSLLLYVQNYVNPDNICLGQTWYLSVDMQLYLISPIILYPIIKNTKIGLLLTGFWTIASLVVVFVICYVNEWYGGQVPLADPNSESRQREYYVATHTRATPWLIGILAGYFLRASISRQFNINKLLVIVGWLLSLAVMAAVLFGMKPLQSQTHEFSYLADTTYLAFTRTAWSLAVLYIICACFFGYGGPVNWFLSLRIWEFLGRLTYSMYLIHMTVQIYFMGNARTVPDFTHTYFLQLYFSDVLITTVIAFFMVLMFESPITVLEKLIFRTGKKKVSSQENLIRDEEQPHSSLQRPTET